MYVYGFIVVLYLANLGDSRAYSCKRDDGKIVCTPLTKDHNPSNVSCLYF